MQSRWASLHASSPMQILEEQDLHQEGTSPYITLFSLSPHLCFGVLFHVSSLLSIITSKIISLHPFTHYAFPISFISPPHIPPHTLIVLNNPLINLLPRRTATATRGNLNRNTNTTPKPHATPSAKDGLVSSVAMVSAGSATMLLGKRRGWTRLESTGRIIKVMSNEGRSTKKATSALLLMLAAKFTGFIRG